MEAKRISDESSLYKYRGFIFSNIGDVYRKEGNKALAKKYYYEGLTSAEEQGNFASIARNNIRLINCFLDEGKKDSLLIYALRNMEVVRSLGTIVGQGDNPNNIASAYENLSLGYKLNNQFDSAFKYQGLALIAKDSLYKERITNLAEFQNMSFGEQMRLQTLETEKVINENKVRTWFLLAGIAILLILATFFYINTRQKHKAKIKIEKAYNDLKVTQQQLIQSEKMASLGELTAGIAHEIQNPLNFVNNFSDVNKELIEELMEERHKAQGSRGQETEDKVLGDIKTNEEKINHHGRRADAIVKGMLQHSRSSKGQRELTDINALADEYLRLAYHGLRAKDQSFNAVPIAIGIKTEFDSSIGQIKIVPQDIGRVILNLINNAFYAVNEKAKLQAAGLAEGQAGYKPLILVSTKNKGNKIEIKVRDNGSGIPEKILDKIFQPFFTTKPTGLGPGLGLSLAYDIITKEHGGTITVENMPGEGAEFIISLPLAA
jgi:signal transduction histidine kinase